MTVPRTGIRAITPEDTFRGIFSTHYGSVFAYAARRVGWDAAGDVAATFEVVVDEQELGAALQDVLTTATIS